MSKPPTLPPEILDLIIDHLRDEPTALKACCLVSKSWVPRTRSHLFADIDFSSPGPLIKSWMKAFPDPSNSPASYTRILSFSRQEISVAASTEPRPWIRSFCAIQSLLANGFRRGTNVPPSLVQFHGISPNLRSLCLYFFPASEILDMICTLTLIEDLSLSVDTSPRGPTWWTPPSASPRLTGSLYLNDILGPIVPGLLSLPDGLHFTKISIVCDIDEAELAMQLVERCSNTLEFLSVEYNPTGFLRSENPPPFDLSKCTKLQNVKLLLRETSVQWVIETIKTAEPKHLREIVIFMIIAPDLAEDVTYREWQDLDHLLAHLWTLHSVMPKIKCLKPSRRNGLGEFVSHLLPELVSKGVVVNEIGD